MNELVPSWGDPTTFDLGVGLVTQVALCWLLVGNAYYNELQLR